MQRVYWIGVICLLLAGVLAVVPNGFAGGPGRYNDFTFARVAYNAGSGGGGWGWGRRGRSWAMDFPSADMNMIRVLRLQTNLRINEPQRIDLNDPEIFEIPFLYILEVGGLNMGTDEADNLREYLLRGGFMLVDDFHGSYQWSVFESQMKRVFPDRTIEEIPMDHPVFHCYFDFEDYPLVPGTAAMGGGRFGGGDGRYEADGAEYGHRCLGIFDDEGRLMVLINWNTDLGDGWENAADQFYPRRYSEDAYRLGINFAIYSMTH